MAENREIRLIVNHSIIKLRNGNTIDTDAYRSTNQGIYVLTKNVANLFNLPEGIDKDIEKLAFIPYDQIEVILYDVAKPEPEKDPTPTSDEPQG